MFRVYYDFVSGVLRWVLVDSNADWGQDLKRLDTYLRNHPEIDNIHIDYMGPHFKSYLGKKSKEEIMKSVLGQGGKISVIPWWGSKRPIECGYYAISVHYFQHSVYKSGSNKKNSYKVFNRIAPIDCLGSFLIYKIDKNCVNESF